jgi:hypothetical protein
VTGKGRHESSDPRAFYRSLVVMIGGIILVGAAMFFVLYLLADNPAPATTTTTSAATTSTRAETSTTGTSTTTTVPTSTTTGVPVRPPNEVRVLVLNSMGLAGAAGRLTTVLDEAGYQTLPASDYAPEQDPSRVWYRLGFSAEANVLVEFIPEARVEEIPDPSVGQGADVVIVLGTGYEG